MIRFYKKILDSLISETTMQVCLLRLWLRTLLSLTELALKVLVHIQMGSSL